MDKRSLLAIVLSLVILIGYQEVITYLYPPPPREPDQTRQLDQTAQSGSQQALSPTAPPVASPPVSTSVPAAQAGQTLQTAAPASTPAVPAHEEKEITIENEVYRAVLTSHGARLKSVTLKDYPGDAGKDSPPREMIRQGADGQLPLEVRLEGNGTGIDDSSVFYAVEGGDRHLQGEGDTTTLVFRGTLPNGIPITKTFSFSAQRYGIGLEVQAEGVPQTISQISLVWTRGVNASQNTNSYYSTDGPVALLGRKFIYETESDLEERETVGPGQIRWAGYSDSYFLAAMMPPAGDNYTSVFGIVNDTVRTALTIPWNGEAVPYLLYIGPKETTALNGTDPSFDRAIDFGWFHFIASPLMSLLRLCHAVTGNYGLDVILLTVLVKLLFFPLSNKSFQSMAAMKKLQPQMERLREQHAGDKQKLNQETMELYKRHKVNPLGGCLPMVLQFPVFIGLYQGLMYAIELRQAPFFGWITDLSQPDRLGSLGLPFVDPPGLPVLTLIMGGSMILQQKMTPMTTGDPMQQKMMMLMPVVFTVMFVNFPAGLVLYWLINNVLSIAQQYWYNSQQEQTA